MFTKAKLVKRTSKNAVILKLSVITFLLLGTTITAITQRELNSGTQAHLCVKDNGQLRLTVSGSCDSSERLVEWTVGGQVTDIQLGQGLIGTRESGTMTLALDPSILQTCAGCGKIVAGFNDGPLQLPEVPLGQEIPQIAKLDVPAGNYAIMAKLVVRANQLDGIPITQKAFAFCKLAAGNDFDNSSALLEVEDDRITSELHNDEVVLSLQLVHRFAESGEVVLRCGDFAFGDATMEGRNLKIIAMEAASISNVFLGND
jgi:hypothetical protein